MVQESASRKLDQYIVRFPDGMRDQLKESAAKNKRSLNAEIIARLEESLLDVAVEDMAGKVGFKPPSDSELRRMAQIIMMFEGLLRKKHPSLKELAALADFDDLMFNPTPMAQVDKASRKPRKKA